MKRSNAGIIAIIVLLCVVIIILLTIMISGLTNSLYDFDWFGKRSDSSVQSEQLEFDPNEIRSINIESDYGNIEIRQSKDEKIHIEGSNSSRYRLSADKRGETLEIKRNCNGPNINFGKAPKVDTIVYLPTDFTCNIDIDTDFGNITSSVSLNGKFDFNTDLGNIELDSIAGEFELETNMGNVEIKEAEITANSSLETNMGDIEVSKTNAVKIISNTDLGSCNVYGSDSSSPITLNAESDMGNVRINN